MWITEAAIARLTQEKLTKYDGEQLLLASLMTALQIVGESLACIIMSLVYSQSSIIALQWMLHTEEMPV